MSRNSAPTLGAVCAEVTPRERRVSRNINLIKSATFEKVTPRERRVSRNFAMLLTNMQTASHASREACE